MWIGMTGAGMGVLVKRGSSAPAMEGLCDEVLAEILRKLPLRDSIRARAVCRRWRVRVEEEGARAYCPLVFKRVDSEHSWEGYDGVRGEWEALPSLSNVPRVINLLPIAGSGHGLLGFKIFSEFSGYIVGNPYSQKWTTLPRSTDCWGDAAMFMASDGPDRFRVVAVRDEDTHIYKSEMHEWTKVGRTPECVHQGQAVSRIKTKVGAAVCNEKLYIASADGTVLISFDIRTERWTDDRIDIPVFHTAKKSMQLLECAGTLFAVTEDDSRVAVWSLAGTHRDEPSPAAVMPKELLRHLKPLPAPARPVRGGHPKLRSVGHGHQLFFWRHRSLSVVAYDLFARNWFKLPEIVRPDIVAHDADRDAPQVTIDAGFFEPKNIFV